MCCNSARWIVALAAVLLSVLPGAAQDRLPACFNRGVAIHNMMNWAAVDKSDPPRYIEPAFAGPDYETSDPLLRNVVGAGFDFIRLTIDPGPFLQFVGAARTALNQHLLDVVRRLLSDNLCVVVDFHPNSQIPDYAPELLVRSQGAPLFRNYVAVVKDTAELLTTLPTDRVALELMNEPQYGWDARTAERWQQMLEFMYGEVRISAPGLLLVLSGARGGDAQGLINVDRWPFADGRVLYSFHYYEPHDFTHQGVESSLPTAWHWQFVSGLPYPALGSDPERVWRKIEQEIEQDKKLDPIEDAAILNEVHQRVVKYIAGGFNRTNIAADFDAVSNWAKRYQIDPHSILLGEFGVTRTYPACITPPMPRHRRHGSTTCVRAE